MHLGSLQAAVLAILCPGFVLGGAGDASSYSDECAAHLDAQQPCFSGERPRPRMQRSLLRFLDSQEQSFSGSQQETPEGDLRPEIVQGRLENAPVKGQNASAGLAELKSLLARCVEHDKSSQDVETPKDVWEFRADHDVVVIELMKYCLSKDDLAEISEKEVRRFKNDLDELMAAMSGRRRISGRLKELTKKVAAFYGWYFSKRVELRKELAG